MVFPLFNYFLLQMTTLESMYGKSFATKHLNQTKITPIIETPELLEFVPPSLSLPSVVKSNNTLCGKQESIEIETTKQSSMSDVLQRTKQIETRTADGKRRVTPITVPRDLAYVPNIRISELSQKHNNEKIVIFVVTVRRLLRFHHLVNLKLKLLLNKDRKWFSRMFLLKKEELDLWQLKLQLLFPQRHSKTLILAQKVARKNQI